MNRNLHSKKINSEQELITLVNEIGIKRIISMYACTCEACPIDGVEWEALDYVYIMQSDMDRGDEWTSFNKKYMPNPTLDVLISHFKILNEKKTYNSQITVNIL